MNRRRFLRGGLALAGLGLLAGCGILPQAQQPAKVPRVGRIARSSVPNPANDALMAAFREGLHDLGYVEGQNLAIEERRASGEDGFAEAAAEVVRLRPDVILVSSSADAREAREVTTSIPIVSAGGGDLVAAGVAASLARPGGNVTGLNTPAVDSKQLQLLQETVPSLARVAVLFYSTTSTLRSEPGRAPFESAARALGLQLQFLGADEGDDLGPAFEAAVRERAGGLLVAGGSLVVANHARIAELAVRYRLPSLWQQTDAVGRGALMAYGPNRADLWRRAAAYVDKILKGAKPADLPVERPDRFDFIVNLRTARALGLTIPDSVLLQATEVIQ